jgi:rhodanese-related sulfurtransferase
VSATIEPSPVVAVPAAESASAVTHFASLLALETDCWDVHHSMVTGRHDFVLLDVRSSEAYAAGHCGGAVSLPRAEIDAAALDELPADTTFVVYCAGPHCNGADRAALEIARLERPVKKMIGGVTGWLDEGFDLVTK